MFPDARQLRSGCIALLAVALLPCAHAAEYNFSPRVLQRFGFDDNLQLTNDIVAIETPMYSLAPGLQVRARGDNWWLQADVEVQIERFDPEFAISLPDVRPDGCDDPALAPGLECRVRALELGEFDTDNQRGSFTLSRFSDRQNLQLEFRINRQAQRTAGEFEAGLLVASRTEDVYVRPSYQRQLSERLSLSVGGSFQNRHFDFTGLSDYEVTGLDAALSRQLSATSSLTLSVFGQEFVAEGRDSGQCDAASPDFQIPFIFQLFGATPDNIVSCDFFSSARESTTLGLQLGWRSFVTERLELNFSAGARSVDARNVNSIVLGSQTNLECVFFGQQVIAPCTAQPDFEVGSTSSGLIARTGLTYRGERVMHSLSLERSVSPIGLGFLVETDLFSGTTTYEFAPRLSGRLGVNYLQSESIAQQELGTRTFDRTFASVDVSLAWRISRDWSFGPGVRYRRQETDFNGIDADATLVYLNLSYRPQTLQVSR